MTIFQPPLDFSDTITEKHHQAYKKLIELGSVVNSDPNILSTAIVSERECWNIIDRYKAKHHIATNPKYLCDKQLIYSKLLDAGFCLLDTYLFDSMKVLDYFRYSKFIIKPRIGAGSVTENPFCYKIYHSLDDFAPTVNQQNYHFLYRMLENADHVIQQAIVGIDQKYGQLHIEGFVNKNGEAVFTSTHEVEFENCRWTNQLQPDIKDQKQINELCEKIQLLISNNNVKNTAFQFQFLRNLLVPNNCWYPTDWQYRCTYNTVFGRVNFEPEICKQYIQFMTNQIETIDYSKLSYYQALINVSPNIAKSKLIELMSDQIINIPFPKNNTDEKYKFLFITADKTFDNAEGKMNEFAQAVAKDISFD